jgi:hypothetical protein
VSERTRTVPGDRDIAPEIQRATTSRWGARAVSHQHLRNHHRCHRYFTHRAFTCGKPLRIALAIVGGIALEGPDALVARRADRPVFFERLGWVRDVRWPDRRRIAACHAESPHKAE